MTTATNVEYGIYDINSAALIFRDNKKVVTDLMTVLEQGRNEYNKKKNNQPYDERIYLASLILLHELCRWESDAGKMFDVEAVYGTSSPRLDTNNDYVATLMCLSESLEMHRV